MNANWSSAGGRIKWALLAVAWLAGLQSLRAAHDGYAGVEEALRALGPVASAPEAPPAAARDEEEEVKEVEVEVEVGQVRRAGVEAVFGQVAKTVVYGGASLARLNNRLLCNFLAHETQLNNTEQPTLYVFSQAREPELAFKIFAHDDVTPDLAREARLDPAQMTYIFVHGWLGGLDRELWLGAAREAVLRSHAPDAPRNSSRDFRPQVLLVEWAELAKGSLYEATANSKRVASRLGRLLKQLHLSLGLQPELMHCIGHSIGAHICGRAAREAFPAAPDGLRRLGRVTAVDPGGFCYELGARNESTFEGMRPSDAMLVDAYYSNRSPFGNRLQVAQFNVRLNGGNLQRSCSVFRDPERGAQYFRAAIRFLLGRRASRDQELLTCDHYYATRFAQQQPLPRHCSYLAYACPSHARFLRGQCGLCTSPNNCYPMDFEFQLAEPARDHHLAHLEAHTGHLRRPQDQGVPYASRRPYYLRTSPREPLCSLTYRVRVHLSAALGGEARHFRNEWLSLQLIGGQEEVMRVWLSASGRAGDTLRLHGPWEPEGELDGESLYGLDNRTLTALFELLPDVQLHLAADGSLARPPVSDLVLFYDNVEAAKRLGGDIARPVDWVQVDYLSSTDPELRRRLSLRRHQDQLRLVYKRLESQE